MLCLAWALIRGKCMRSNSSDTMTEGGATRMKRNGARLFKNPPQPHMCIQDFIQGTTAPCYVNVLSWDKIEMPCRPSQPVPLYGGMRVPPPRTKAEAVVFAVMANPEVLRINGKNAQDPKKRSTLIELLLDFVEAMNAGVVFTRRYTILKDRDITGELKEVWNAVQVRRDREPPPPQQETWIDAQPPVPQYPQYQDQQQQQEYAPQPPQYHTSVAYGRTMGNDGMIYDSYTHQSQTPVMPQNDQLYQSGQIVPQQYHGNMPRIMPDSYNYRERGRENIVQNIPQQSCPAYPTPQYQFQQLPRQMVPQYVNSNVHPNANLSYGPPANTGVNPAMGANLAAPFQPYITYQQRMDNTMHVDIRRMQQKQQQQQQQQQQMHMNHVQPVPQYDPAAPFNVQATSSMNVLRLGRPHMGVAQKNNASKRQMNSPTHLKQPQSCSNCQPKEHQSENNGTKPKSPVKVLQREVPLETRQENNSSHATEGATSNFLDKSQPMSSQEDAKNVQVTDLDEDVRKTNDSELESIDSKKQNESTETSTTEPRRDVRRENSIDEMEEKQHQDPEPESVQGILSIEQKSQKPEITVMKGNKHKENADSNRTIRIRFVPEQNKVDSPKRSQTTVNSIIKSVFKIHPGMSGEETSSGKRKSNGQVKGNRATENEETQQQGYTILKKNSESAQEEVMSEIAQISIQDCKDATEVGPVLS